MARIGFIGTGEIAAQMVRGLAGQGHQIVVSERNRETAAELAETFSDVSIAPNQTVIDQSDIVWLALMADTARSVLPSLKFRQGQHVLSAMLGVPHEELLELCAPVTSMATTIPLPFIATGGCPLPVYPESPILVEIFGERNTVIPVTSEAALNAHFAASALSSVIFSQLQTGTDWVAEQTGSPEGAERYVSSLFRGYLSSLPSTGVGHFAAQLDSLSTEGGLNATLRARMTDHGTLEVLRDGLDSFRGRLGLPEKG